MRRREFITLVGGTAVAWPLAASAQQPATPVIGVLDMAPPVAEYMAGFRAGLKETGYVEGQNVTVEYRSAEGKYDRLSGLAADFVRRPVAVIATVGLAAALAAKSATTKISVVFLSATDPVKDGLVASFNRPGGNITGVSNLNAELVRKRLELLREVVPNAPVIGLLLNPNNPNAEQNVREAEDAARQIGRQLFVVKAGSEPDFEPAFAVLAKERVGALVIAGDPLFNGRPEQLAALTIRHAMPAIYQLRAFATTGGLMSYGASLADQFRLAGVYTGRILKGAKPVDLPVQQVTKVELIINLKTAKALGLTFPLPLLGRADEVIE